MATLVEGRELLQTVASSVLASVGVTLVFSIAIWGVARFSVLSRSDKPVAATAAALLASAALGLVGAAVVTGIVVMASS